MATTNTNANGADTGGDWGPARSTTTDDSGSKEQGIGVKHPVVTEVEEKHTKTEEKPAIEALLDPRLKDYPYPLVARTVDLEDDPSEPVLTFRFWFLTTLWGVIGSAISTIFYFKPFDGALSSSAVQLLSWGCGRLMAKCLPTREFNIFGFKWTMNPGPFRIKEHVMITTAYGNAVYTAYAIGALTALELWYDNRPKAIWGVMYLVTSQFIGYGVAGLLREHLVTPPSMYYPLELPSVALFNVMHKDSPSARLGVKFFAWVTAVAFCWEWFPQYIMPVLSSLPLICWFGHGNPIAYVLGSGTYGFGLFDMSLDINYFMGRAFAPLWVTITQGTAVIFVCWILYPIFYYTHTFGGMNFGAMSTRIYTADGDTYNTTQILTPDFRLNVTAMEEYGHPHWGTSYVFRFFWSFTATAAVMAYAILYYGKEAWNIAKTSFQGRKIEYNDPYLELMSKYPKVPRWWYYSLLVVSISLSLVTFYQGGFQLPWWGFFVFFFIALALTYPNGILNAISGTGVGDTMLTDLVAGFIFHGKPMAVLSCFSFASPILDQSLGLLATFKFGFYMKIPEREMFIGQMWGTLLVPLVNYGTMRLVIDNIDRDVLKGVKPSVSWNALGTRAWYSASVLWGIIGPQRFFGKGSEYSFVYYGVLIGVATVLIAYAIQRWKPSWKTEEYFNAPVFFSSFGDIPTSPMTFFFSAFLFAIFFMGYVFRYHPVWWTQYYYLFAIGLGCGAALQSIFMAFAINLPGVEFPAWFGNNVDYPDRCVPPNDKLPLAMQM